MTVLISCAFAVAVIPLVVAALHRRLEGRRALRLGVLHRDAARRDRRGRRRAHAIVGTLVITGAATIISVPIGIMAAIYLQRVRRQAGWRATLTFFVDVMTGIPSIVAGLFAYALFAIFLGPGIRLGIMGAVALSVLMIPIVVRSTEEMLRIVPNQPARGVVRARGAEVAHDHEGRAPDGARRHRHGRDARGRPHRRRDRAAADHDRRDRPRSTGTRSTAACRTSPSSRSTSTRPRASRPSRRSIARGPPRSLILIVWPEPVGRWVYRRFWHRDHRC